MCVLELYATVTIDVFHAHVYLCVDFIWVYAEILIANVVCPWFCNIISIDSLEYWFIWGEEKHEYYNLGLFYMVGVARIECQRIYLSIFLMFSWPNYKKEERKEGMMHISDNM